jgi:ribosomal protein L11 methyltransferase
MIGTGAQLSQEQFRPMRIGRRLLVTPTWVDAPLEPGLIQIRLDPGRAFGNGAHPTTQLCLAALERHLPSNATVIDVGTGTGILAIAAAKLGAGAVLAFDTDPEAVRVARANVTANDLVEKVRVEEGSLVELLTDQWGVVAASLMVVNILAGVIVDLFAQGLPQIVAPGGLLIISGLLQLQTPAIRTCLRWCGLQQLAQEQKDGWVCILAQRA